MESSTPYGHIYRITNTDNDKTYIGATTLDNPKHRWRKHKYCAKYDRDGFLYNAIRKYGESAFEFEVIAKAHSRKELNLVEKALIRLFRSHYTEGGYNIDWGGNVNKTSERTREKMSKVQHDLGIVCPVDQYDLEGNLIGSYSSMHEASKETGCALNCVCACCNGNSLTTKGNVFRHKGDPFDKYPLKREYFPKPVDVYDKTGKKLESYGSVTKCAESIGVTIANVSSGCRGECYTVDGYVIRFKDDPFDKYPIEGKTSAKRVVQIDPETGEELRKFDTITRAYDHLGKQCNQGISLVCKGKQNTCHGYKWRYAS